MILKTNLSAFFICLCCSLFSNDLMNWFCICRNVQESICIKLHSIAIHDTVALFHVCSMHWWMMIEMHSMFYQPQSENESTIHESMGPTTNMWPQNNCTFDSEFGTIAHWWMVFNGQKKKMNPKWWTAKKGEIFNLKRFVVGFGWWNDNDGKTFFLKKNQCNEFCDCLLISHWAHTNCKNKYVWDSSRFVNYNLNKIDINKFILSNLVQIYFSHYLNRIIWNSTNEW